MTQRYVKTEDLRPGHKIRVEGQIVELTEVEWSEDGIIPFWDGDSSFVDYNQTVFEFGGTPNENGPGERRPSLKTLEMKLAVQGYSCTEREHRLGRGTYKIDGVEPPEIKSDRPDWVYEPPVL